MSRASSPAISSARRTSTPTSAWEYDVIGIEEATTLTSRKYHDIVACCRTSQPGWRPRIYSTTNPGGGGHAWYRSKCVAPFQARGETTPRSGHMARADQFQLGWL